MKTFIKTHKKICISLGIIFMLILGFVIWIEVKIGFDNLPLNKISGTVVSVYPPKNANDKTKLLIELDDPSSWPKYEYAYVNCTTKGIKEGDSLYILCSDWMFDSDPPGLSAYFTWKKTTKQHTDSTQEETIKSFILSHKKLCIALLIIFLALPICFVWLRRCISADNLPFHKISGTVQITRTIRDSDGEETYIEIKLDDPYSWPKCEYADIRYDEGNLKEGDRISMICGGGVRLSKPPALSAYWVWKK